MDMRKPLTPSRRTCGELADAHLENASRRLAKYEELYGKSYNPAESPIVIHAWREYKGSLAHAQLFATMALDPNREA